MRSQPRQSLILVAIKLLHTAIWLFFAGCIVTIPFAAAAHGSFRLVALLTGLVLLECAVLAANQCRCPLTVLAVPHTLDRRPNFDIYLPIWLARENTEIFGTLFIAAELPRSSVGWSSYVKEQEPWTYTA